MTNRSGYKLVYIPAVCFTKKMHSKAIINPRSLILKHDATTGLLCIISVLLVASRDYQAVAVPFSACMGTLRVLYYIYSLAGVLL